MFKKIEIWILYLVLLLGIPITIGFGFLVRQEVAGNIKLGWVSKTALFLAETPISLIKISNSDFKVKAHKHNVQIRKTSLTQEAWVVLKGKIKAKFYDLDDKLIFETILKDGDCISIFRGGHSLEVLEDKTIFYEFKNGPYNGVAKDKVFIDG